VPGRELAHQGAELGGQPGGSAPDQVAGGHGVDGPAHDRTGLAGDQLAGRAVRLSD